jgi:adenylate kinase
LILLLFGPPGAGKGTQSAYLIEKRSMAHISTGNLFRTNIKNETELGLKAKSFMDAGDLVPDSVTVGMVESELESLKGQSVIFDGFPRTVPQAEAFDELLTKMSLKIDHAIFMEVPSEMLVERLSGRRMTADGKHVYHVQFNPPKQEGTCDVTGEELIQRRDDKAEVISNRLEAYEKSTSPLKEYYESKGVLKSIDGTGEPEDVFARIEAILSS